MAIQYINSCNARHAWEQDSGNASLRSLFDFLDDGHVSHGCGMPSRYGPVLEGMYTQMEQRQRERQSAMRDAAAQGTVLDKVKQVISSGPMRKLVCKASS